MKEEARNFETDLAVIGSGIAGFAASIFAVNRKINCAQVGNTGAVAYTTGYLDLLGAAKNLNCYRQSLGWPRTIAKSPAQSSSQPDSRGRYKKKFRTVHCFSWRMRYHLYRT